MDSQDHIVSGVYASRAEAETVRSHLLERGLPAARVKVVESAGTAGRADNRKLAADDEVLKDVLVDGVAGAALGTGIFALGEVALVAANVTLFVASPLVAPLAMLGWGAALGGVVGAAVGASEVAQKKGRFSDFVLDAVRNSHVVLVVHTQSAAEKSLACDAIGDSLVERRALSV